jgi:CobQ-like glutamine amidotransferase family enzyme
VLHGASRPLARVVSGVGNGEDQVEGAQQGRVLATYLHGPVLVRNPQLADHLLSRIVGGLAEFEEPDVERLREERLKAADRRRGGGRLRWLFGR